jgi:hypothetical protein
MLGKHILRSTALCLAMLAAPMSLRAENVIGTDSFSNIINVIKTFNISTTDIENLEKSLKEVHDAALIISINAYDADPAEIKEVVPALRAVIDELTTKISILEIQSGDDAPLKELLHYAKYYIDSADAWATRNMIWNQRVENVCNFAQGLISSATYSDAWHVVTAPDTLLGKAEILWNHHKPALAGAAIVATATVATIYACRNKIKAGWNRLFGPSTPTENNEETQA